MRKPLTLKHLVIGVLAVLAGAAIPPNITVSMTDSVKYKVFILKRCFVDHGINKGSYIVFPLKENEYFDVKWLGANYAIKRVACIEGDKLRFSQGRYYCNEQMIGEIKRFSRTGKTVRPFQFTGIVPRAMLFVAGDHPDSYDSRYFGFVRRSEVYAVAYPLY